MGWVFKGLVLVVGLCSLPLGGWPISLVCFGYLGYSVWRGRRRRTVFVQGQRPREAPRTAKRSVFKKRYIAATFFFLLWLIAVGNGGVYSPWLFFAIGAIIVASGVVNRGPAFSDVEEVPESIMLKSRWFPFSWVSLVEVKFGTEAMSKALSSVGNEVMMIVSSEKIAVYLPLRVRASSVSSAESKASEKLAPIARMLSARGAYTLPLESKEAAAMMNWSLKPVDVAVQYGQDGVTSLNSTPFDVLVLAPSGHLLESVAGYVVQQNKNKKPGHYKIPVKGRKLENPPLLWEALETLAEKHQPQKADAVTGFLSSMSATRGESLGDRLENGGPTEDGKVVVASLGSEQVELTRPQLRAIVRAYG